jgi:excisionase family DNA binding protein
MIETQIQRLTKLVARNTALLQQLLDQQTVERWYTIKEAAPLLSMSEFTLRMKCKLGMVEATKKGKSWYISRKSINEYKA